MTYFTRILSVALSAVALLSAGTLNALDTKDYRFHRMPETSYYGGINSIAEDALGRIWFTGTDAFFVFDGIAFKQVRLENPSPGTPLDYRSVRSTPDGSLFVSTNVGLFRMDHETGEFILESPCGFSILEIDGQGRLWFLMDDVLTCRAWDGSLSSYPLKDVRPDACHCTPSSVFISASSTLWRLDVQTGAFSLMGTYADRSADRNQSPAIADIEELDGKYYILSESDGIFQCAPDGSVTAHFAAPRENGKAVLSKQLHIGADGNILVATQTGLQFVDPRTGETSLMHSDLKNPHSIPNESVWCFSPGNERGLWIGTYGGKLAYQSFEDDDVTVLNPSVDGLNHPIVSAFAEDAQGRLWIGSEGGGLLCRDLEHSCFVDFQIKQSQPSDISRIKRLKCIGNTLYIASFRGGICCLDLNNYTLRNLNILDPDDHSPLSVYDFEVDGNDGIWLSNPDTDLMYWKRSTGKVERVYGLEPDGSESRLRTEAISKSPDGMLVLATHVGVVVVDPVSREIIRRFRIEGNDIRLNNLTCFCRTGLSEIWFGTKGAGVARLSLDGGMELVRDSEGRGLDGICVFGILRDNVSGDVWMSTDSGLYVYRKESGLFEKSNIGSKGECGAYYLRSAFSASDGRLIFGGTNGLISFNPLKVNRNSYKPKAFFTSFLVNDQPYGRPGQPVRLKRRQSNFEIGFSSDSYLEIEKNSFAYRMVGLSDKWTVLPAGQNFVRFLNLRAGHYRFEVKAANNVGIWGDEVSSIRIVIKPHPLLSPLAWLVYILLIGILVWTLWNYTTRRKMLEQQLELEMEKEENLRELNRVRNEFFTNISHDLKTPLTLVVDPLKQLEQQIPSDAPYQNLVSMIGRNVARIQRMLTQLLQFRQIETVKAPVNVGPGDIVKFVDSVFSLFEFYANKKQIETEFLSWVESYPALFDAEMVEKVFTNLFSNAIKYTTEEGYVGVRIALAGEAEIPADESVSPEATWISFTVTNSGSEIPQSKYKSIFEPFNDEGKTKLEFESHTGLGLAIVQALVTDMKGTISVASADNNVSFTVLLPLVPCEESAAVVVPEETQEDIYDYATAEIDAMISEIDEMQEEDVNHTRKADDVLVIEDDAQLRSYLEKRLSKHYNVYTAANGNDGIAKAGRIMPRIIITDLLMPGASGFEVCQALRNDIKTSHIPIIALSATGDNTNFKIEALESGANVFIDKPVDMDYLLKQVANLIRNQDKLKELFSRRFVAEPSKIATSSVDEELMKKAVGFIERNFENEDYGVEDFVSDMAIARTRLYQKINDLTGMSIKEFILDIRLKRASQLLRESEYTIAEISTMTGFASPKYFSVCFRRHFGQSPTEFKANADAE